MSQSLAIVNIGQLVTLSGPSRPRVGKELGELGIIPNAAILIEDGRINATGTYADLKAQIPPHAAVIDAENRCVTPGFVDAHTHLVFAGNRAAEFEQRIAGATYQQIASAGGGILSTVRQTRAASEDDLLAAARAHRNWMLRTGTTTIEAKSGYGLRPEDEYKLLRVIGNIQPLRTVPTFLGAHEIPDEFRKDPAKYVDLVVQEMLPKVAAERLDQSGPAAIAGRIAGGQ